MRLFKFNDTGNICAGCQAVFDTVSKDSTKEEEKHAQEIIDYWHVEPLNGGVFIEKEVK